MKKNILSDLSRRERQIMDIVYKNKEASAAKIRELLPDKITDSGVRTLLRVLVTKGFLKRKEENFKYIYYPTITLEKAQYSAIEHIKQTFFSNSAERVVTALLKTSDLSEQELNKLISILNDEKNKRK
jgi:predicted transcriptional regulator